MRLISFVFGLSSLAAMATLTGTILAQWTDYRPWWLAIGLFASVVLPLMQVVIAWIAPVRWLRITAFALASAWLLALLLLEAGLVRGELAPEAGAPWIIVVTPIPAAAAALGMPAVAAWTYCVVVSAFVGIDRVLAFPSGILDVAAQDALVALLVQSVVVALVLVTLQTARLLDRAAAEAQTDHVIKARLRAAQRERVRAEALIHDHVLTVLLVASRRSSTASDQASRLADNARSALELIEQSDRAPAPESAYVDASELSQRAQAITTELAPLAAFESHLGRDIPLPREVAEAMVEAAAEALRNSIRHAGPEGISRAVQVDSDDDRCRILVLDDGPGFDQQRVSDVRLGIRLSIVERMRSVGGSARISSEPGKGTVVELVWIDG